MTSRSPTHLLNQRVTILRPTSQTNDFGLPHLVWQDHLQNVPALPELLGSEYGASRDGKVQYKFHLPLETDIRQLDRIAHDGRLFQVLVITNQDRPSHVLSAMTTEVHP
ncbi:MAG: hypothetical protein CMJ19_20470 [Phycisphaeraceae bacterium]|nr:hypothetical protein [Phycisphaeraceae bacterium]